MFYKKVDFAFDVLMELRQDRTPQNHEVGRVWLVPLGTVLHCRSGPYLPSFLSPPSHLQPSHGTLLSQWT